ncbi:hypothetical protein [Aquabacter sediminis]|uniref:hypothetical protein n=1 Tax=Aquabacter sediminis TaxID=3029197 RepID=UPI00237E29B1|nr:hypothetical protein [Aquabacter sp. P-9]MDE1567591.1 hypothetical protein [Aquabacter sp. P-9]
MRITATVTGGTDLAARLAAALEVPLARRARLEAGAALAERVAQAGVVPLVEEQGDRVLVGSDDPAAIARETGTLNTAPTPWLLPSAADVRARR